LPGPLPGSLPGSLQRQLRREYLTLWDDSNTIK
jgi:hypothetical protein